ncbi:hypothetical protein Tco_0553965 [Tanacetum coccineum]
MVEKIITCVSTTFSICVNGERFGFFKADRGLSLGDLMSPYLFTLVMEILSIIVQEKVKNRKEFKYHFGCRSMKLTHKGKKGGKNQADDLSEEDYTSMSRVKHLAMIPTRRIVGMEDDDDNACDALVRKLGLNNRCEASLAKLAKDVSYGLMKDENDAYVMNDVQSDEGEAIGKRLKLESQDLKSVEATIGDQLSYMKLLGHKEVSCTK